jgi:hypothetical protein
MKTRHRVRLAVATLTVILLVPDGTAARVAAQDGGATPPVLAGLTVTGTGVTTYPGFDPSAPRFGIRTTADTGPLRVTATTADPDDVLTVGGQLVNSGATRLFRGMKPGEQITVRVANAEGERSYDLVYLPPSFPVIDVTTRRAGIAPGFLYLGFFTGPPFLAVVDDNGVPVYVHRRPAATYDFKRQPNGRYTFLETTDDETVTGRTIFDAVIMDEAMRVIRRRRTLPPLTNTDNHDVLLLPGGRRILLSYEPVVHDGVLREDSVIQEVADGRVVLQWSSWGDIPLSDNLSGNLVEYAHINSVWVDDDGNLLASLRGVSAVVKVNRRTGRLMWTLGGRSNDFDIEDPLGGFCGQHHAQRLRNGNLLLFDNGADCAPDGSDRGVSRAVEYAIDEEAMTAEVVWSHTQGIYGFATGSVQRMANGNTLIGWGTSGFISEVDAGGEVLFETRPVVSAGGSNALSYRAHRAPYPDRVRPRIHFTTPGPVDTLIQGDRVRAAYACYDEGGSSLATCDGSVRAGAFLDTSTPGEHSITVTAVDEAANQRQVTRTYRVSPSQPDLAVRREPDGRLVGNDVYGLFGGGQTRVGTVGPRGRVTFTVRAENDANDPDTFVISGSAHDDEFRVRYFDGGRDVTAAVKDGAYRLRQLQPHRRHELQVVVTARPRVDRGARIDVYVLATSLAHADRFDMVKMAVRRT